MKLYDVVKQKRIFTLLNSLNPGWGFTYLEKLERYFFFGEDFNFPGVKYLIISYNPLMIVEQEANYLDELDK